MTEINKFRLKEAIDKAFEKFVSLEGERQTPVNMALVAREFAPKTIKQVLDVMNEFPELMIMEAKQGHLIIDVLIATITDNMGLAMSQLYLEKVNKDNGQAARNQLLIAGR